MKPTFNAAIIYDDGPTVVEGIQETNTLATDSDLALTTNILSAALVEEIVREHRKRQ
jgi:hypothetical protein